MTLTQVGGVLLIFLLCPLLGGLPLIAWIVQLFGHNLRQLGTGNISVSAAFYHGGKGVGILAVSSEALKGIAAVLLARYFFPNDPVWEIMALIALVMGRYWFGRGAGTTNVVWGYGVHDPMTSLLTALIGGVGFTILRERRTGKLGVLVLLPLLTALRHPAEADRVWANVLLSVLIAWIYQKIPDDLELSADSVQASSSQVFRFFQGHRSVQSLDRLLDPTQVGAKAATLSQLKRWGYPVPQGWVLPPGDDPAPLVAALIPTAAQPFVVRSSAIGEDSQTASAAGQYETLLNITSQAALEQAILRCQTSYNLPAAVRYRRDRHSELEPEGGMAVLVQPQIAGLFSGVAFSRDPIEQGEAVVVEALPGMASQVVSGRSTPEQYRVWLTEADLDATDWVLPNELNLSIEGHGEVPPRLIQQVAYLARQLEARYHGIPQDIEWSYDGQQLWLLQARPITTMLPIWTRKIAAEVIPGFIHPLTWSINRPITCQAWGDLFTLVLGQRAEGLAFEQTATLHRSAAYFNASLLGDIFRRMGLPPESLEFLTRGAKFSKPPLKTTWRNLPGLLRLAQAELRLEKDFAHEYQTYFQPELAELAAQPADSLSPEALLSRIQQILALLQRATYYSILAPLSAAIRPALWRIDPQRLDNSQTPEVASVRAIQAVATHIRSSQLQPALNLPLSLAELSQTHPDWAEQIDRLLTQYGYLSEVGTDIAVPTWREDPRPVVALLTQFMQHPPAVSSTRSTQRKLKVAQRRLDLKGRVTDCYSRILAELRWSFVALEQCWLKSGYLEAQGDIFCLSWPEIQQLIADPLMHSQLQPIIAQRQLQLNQDRQLKPPMLVYGNTLPQLARTAIVSTATQFQGIAASPGQVSGQVLVLRDFQDLPPIDRRTILVVPYTDSGWAALLAQAGGLIAEVGGQLSHGAIVAREYGIPAVMNLTNATEVFKTGQKVKLDGTIGRVEIL